MYVYPAIIYMVYICTSEMHVDVPTQAKPNTPEHVYTSMCESVKKCQEGYAEWFNTPTRSQI